MRTKRSFGGAFTKPPGKQVAGRRYKSSLTPMAIPAAKKARRSGFKKRT